MSTTFAQAALVINEALFDSMWQGVLITGLVWLGLRCLRQLGSASRYTIWLCALAALVAIPVFTALMSGQLVRPKATSTATEVHQPTYPVRAPQPGPAPHWQSRPAAAAAETLSARLEQAAAGPRPGQIAIPEAFVLAIVLIWALVTFGRMLRLAMDFREIAAVRREGYVWSKAFDFPVYVSNRVRVPIAIGFLEPAVILPASILEQVDERALEAVLIHEIAHLRRYDVWTNAFAQVIGTFLALNPVAWFVARQISTEREMACDDWVVARSASSEAFARVLASMASHTRGRIPVATPSALGSRHAIVLRIEQLLDDARPRKLHFSTAALGGAFMLLALLAFILQAVSPALAFAQLAGLSAKNSPATLALNCTQRDRGPLRHHQLGLRGPTMDSPSMPDDRLLKIVARYPATTTTYEVSVDAAGHPHNFTILHASKYPALDQRVAHSVLSSTFDPARHNCVAIASTFRSASSQLPRPTVFVITRPATPVIYGRSTKIVKGGCSVPHRNPAIVHLVLPVLTDSMKKQVAMQRTILNTVNVRLDASGAVTSAVVGRSSGQRAFDDATVLAAKRTTYAPRVVNCKPISGDYFIIAAFTDRLEP